MPDLTADPTRLRWYQGIDRYCWVVLVVAALGWMFDTMDQNLFNLVRAQSIKDLLGARSADKALVSGVGQWVTSAFLVGWSVGGFIFGMLGDRIGRTGTMIITILIYAIFTGLSGLVHSWPWYAAARFMTGLGVGGEWAAGAAIVAEVWPARSRPMALGLLQSLSAVGNMLAAIVTLALAGLSWRWAYAVGAAPALLVLWIRSVVKEPQKWVDAKAHATVGREMGKIGALFREPGLRRNTIAALLMAIAGQGIFWGVAVWSVDLLLAVLQPYNVSQKDFDRVKSTMYFMQQVGALFGVWAFTAWCERTSRRAAFFTWFAMGWIAVPVFFWGVAKSAGVSLGFFGKIIAVITFSHRLPPGPQSVVVAASLLAVVMGFATLGPFAGYTVYFPELYPTRLRATGCGICYNGARFLAAIVPPVNGMLAAHFAAQPGAVAGGLPAAATAVSCVYILGFIGTLLGPETRGKPLPEESPDPALQASATITA
jgi:MFS family permease